MLLNLKMRITVAQMYAAVSCGSWMFNKNTMGYNCHIVKFLYQYWRSSTWWIKELSALDGIALMFIHYRRQYDFLAVTGDWENAIPVLLQNVNQKQLETCVVYLIMYRNKIAYFLSNVEIFNLYQKMQYCAAVSFSRSRMCSVQCYGID